MVSLAPNNNGYFGEADDHPIIPSSTYSGRGDDGDDELIGSRNLQIVSGPEISHQPIRTTCAILLAKLFYVTLGVAAFVLPVVCGDDRCKVDSMTMTQYIHGALWFLLFALDRFLKYRHEKSRRMGYLHFYQLTRNLRRMPLTVNSCANAVMVIESRVLEAYCSTDGHCHFLTKTNYIQILISVECIIALIFLIIYFVHTVRFNHKKALPDVTQDEMMTSFVNPNIEDIGFRDTTYIDQVLERQADMIRYLRQHSAQLAAKQLHLKEENNKQNRYIASCIGELEKLRAENRRLQS